MRNTITFQFEIIEVKAKEIVEKRSILFNNKLKYEEKGYPNPIHCEENVACINERDIMRLVGQLGLHYEGRLFDNVYCGKNSRKHRRNGLNFFGIVWGRNFFKLFKK